MTEPNPEEEIEFEEKKRELRPLQKACEAATTEWAAASSSWARLKLGRDRQTRVEEDRRELAEFDRQREAIVRRQAEGEASEIASYAADAKARGEALEEMSKFLYNHFISNM